MHRRSYRLGKRGQSAQDTRRRIVEATYALHAEQGVVATSMKQIAERAGVATGTVYHHFPEYSDAIDACGAHFAELSPMPAVSLFDGHATPAGRLHALALAWFTHYAGMPGWARLHAERDRVPQIDAQVRAQQDRRMAQLREALRPLPTLPPASRLRAAAALLDTGTYLALRGAGFDLPGAADEIAAVLACRLLPAPTARSQ